MLSKSQDTIIGLATPYGTSGVAVLRISGSEALRYTQKLGKSLRLTPKEVKVCPLWTVDHQKKLDEVCLLYFKGPQSFTGEDVVEVHCHGNPLVIRNILSSYLALGARAAENGEFTKRAYINGKLDLTKAEAIADLIHAKSEEGTQVSLSHLSGTLYQKLMQIRAELITLLEHIEASIDFPDEVDTIDPIYFTQTINKSLAYTQSILDHQDYGKRIYAGVKCLILGYPNVGKSSLLNALLGESRALVSDIAGTTRDFIDAQLELEGFIFEFIDTAGIHNTNDTIEKMGIEKIHALTEKADIILWVIDSQRELHKDEVTYIGDSLQGKETPVIALLNKCDLGSVQPSTDHAIFKGKPLHYISTQTQEGFEKLKKELVEQAQLPQESVNHDLVCNARQIGCIQHIQSTLETIQSSMASGIEHDLISVDLKLCISKIGEITGSTLTEEVLDGIFSRFCVGK